MHAHDGRDVRFLQLGENHVSALDTIGANLRSVEASGGQPVPGSEVDKTAMLSTFVAILSTFLGGSIAPLPVGIRIYWHCCPGPYEK